MPGEKWGYFGLLCFSMFCAFVVPFLPDSKTGQSNPLQALWWAVPGAVIFGIFAVVGFLSWRRRRGRVFVWNDESLWIEHANIVEWEFRWSELSHLRSGKGLFGKLAVVDTLGNEHNVSSMSAVDASNNPILVRILRTMATDPSKIPQPEVRKKMPKWQVVLYGFGAVASGTIGIQQLLSFQTNIRSESPQPVSVVQLCIITSCTLLFALWSVLFVSGLGTRRSVGSLQAKPYIPRWTLENFLAYGARPSPYKEVRFRVPSATTAKQYVSFAKGTFWAGAVFFAGLGVAACVVSMQQMQHPTSREPSSMALALIAVPLLAVSALITAYLVRDRAVGRHLIDVLAFNGDNLVVLREGRQIAVGGWKDAIRRVRGVLELDVDGQRTHYDLSGWGQEVRYGNGE